MGLLNTLLQHRAAKRANETNIRLAREAQQFEQKMWEQQNEYNTPQAQMQRFVDAGLNPNLMYGQGNAGNASSSPMAHRAEVKSELSNANIPSVLNMIQQAVKIRKELSTLPMAKYQEDYGKFLLRQGSDSLNEKYIKEIMIPAKIGTQQHRKLANENELFEATEKLQKSLLESKAKREKAQSTLADYYSQFGINAADSIYFRLASILLGKLGVNPDKLFNLK